MRPHEFPIWIEQNAHLVVAPADPNGQHWSLESGAQIVRLSDFVVLVEKEQTDVVATRYANALLTLYNIKHDGCNF